MIENESEEIDYRKLPEDFAYIFEAYDDDDQMPCNFCIVRPTCKRVYDDICDDRIQYLETKMNEKFEKNVISFFGMPISFEKN